MYSFLLPDPLVFPPYRLFLFSLLFPYVPLFFTSRTFAAKSQTHDFLLQHHRLPVGSTFSCFHEIQGLLLLVHRKRRSLRLHRHKCHLCPSRQSLWLPDGQRNQYVRILHVSLRLQSEPNVLCYGAIVCPCRLHWWRFR